MKLVPQFLFENRILFMHAVSTIRDSNDFCLDGLCTAERFGELIEQPGVASDHLAKDRPHKPQETGKEKIRIIGLRQSSDSENYGSVYWVAIGRATALREKLTGEQLNNAHNIQIVLPGNGYQFVPDRKSYGWRLTNAKYVEYVETITSLAGLLTEEPFLSNPRSWGDGYLRESVTSAYQEGAFRLLRGQVRNLMNQFMLEWGRWTDDMPPSISNCNFLRYLAAASTVFRKASDNLTDDISIQRAYRRCLFKFATGQS